MTYTPTLDISVRFALPTEIVWTALTDARLSAQWWPSLELEPVRGGEFRIQTPRPLKKRARTGQGRLTAFAHGEFAVELESAPRHFVSHVTMSVSQAKHKAKLRIVESGLPDGQYAELIAAECRDGWREVLAAFEKYLEDADNVRRVERRCGS